MAKRSATLEPVSATEVRDAVLRTIASGFENVVSLMDKLKRSIAPEERAAILKAPPRRPRAKSKRSSARSHKAG